jgi:predicted deacylase
MSETGWLILSLVAGTVLAVGWVSRERAIHRRRRRRSDREETNA